MLSRLLSLILLAPVLVGCSGGNQPEPKQKVGRSISECLADQRSDLAVSDWLDNRVQRDGVDALPPEVAAAYRTDVFVREVNSGGIFGFIDWEPNLVKPTVKDLETIGAAKQAKVLQSAIAMLKLKTWPPSEGELDTAREKIWDDAAASDRFDKLSQEIIDDSGILAGLTHDYIRRHIEVFK